MRADKPLGVFFFNTKSSLLDPEPTRILRRRDKPLQCFVPPLSKRACAARSFSFYRIRCGPINPSASSRSLPNQRLLDPEPTRILRRRDKPLSVFSFNTKPSLLDPEPSRVMRRRDEASRRKLQGIQRRKITSRGSAFMPRRSCHGSEQSPQQLFVNFPRTCVGRWSYFSNISIYFFRIVLRNSLARNRKTRDASAEV